MRRNFNVREFPEERVANAGGPLADEEMTALLRDESGEPLACCAGPCPEVRELIDAALLMCNAKLYQRAIAAFGLSGRAH